MKTLTVRHPARYTDLLLPVFAQLAKGRKSILDPMAGTGKIFLLREHGITTEIKAIEIEPEWAAMHPETQMGNALDLPFPNSYFDCVIVSPCYGNRMADHHHAKDSSHRNTYTHALGRTLHDDNSGAMQWGLQYKAFHVAAWAEVHRVLCVDGSFILNVKDHIRKGQRQHVVDWHIETLVTHGFTLLQHVKVNCPGNRFGQNGKARIDYESVLEFKRV